MKNIDLNYDDILSVNYELYSVKLSELKRLANSWYDGVDFSEFDTRADDKYLKENDIVEMKLSGLVSNYFYAYKEGGKFYLLDGYNRLFTDYGKLNVDPIVYLKVINDECTEAKLMSIMFRLNMWKLQQVRLGGLKTYDFLDRGFRLFLNKKFKISLHGTGEYNAKIRYQSDFSVLDFYFRNEKKIACYWAHPLEDIIKLFSHKNVVNDIREIVRVNDYIYEDIPFKNYNTFLNGFVMFLSWRRVSGDDRDYKFNDYVDKLKKDKFYKKLIKMSGTDSTRINVYNFFREVYQNDNIKK